MKDLFYTIKKHPHHLGIVVVGLGTIVDGLVNVLSLGYLGSNFSWLAITWSMGQKPYVKD